MDKQLLNDIIQWDTVNWGQIVPIWTPALKSPTPLTCLEVGAQKGGLSLWAAKMGHNVVCSDLHDPRETALVLHKKYGVNEQIQYQSLDVLTMPYRDHFDIVFLKSILPTIGTGGDKEKQRQAVKSIFNSLKPGGKLLFAENLRATALHAFARRKFVSWGNKLRYTHLDEMKEFMEDFSTIEYKTFGFLGVFGKTQNQRRILGRIDSVFNRIIPEKWNYLMIGVATK